jgi:integrase
VDAPREADHQIDPPDRATVKALLEASRQTPHGAAFWLLAYTGARRGEVCALKQDHLDIANGSLSIVGSVGRQDGQLVTLPPKSASSRRLIHLDATTVALLRTHLARQAEYRLSLGGAYRDQGLMFTAPTGGLLDPDILTRTWQGLCREVGVKYRLHDLRHAHATTLIEAGAHIKAVQARLGHSSPSLTMAVYAHVSPGMDQDAADAYARAMSG